MNGDGIPDDYREEMIEEFYRKQMERDNDACGYIPQKEDEEWRS